MLELIAPPTVHPVTVPAMRQHLRVDGDCDDYTIEALIAAATVHVERRIERALMPQTWELRLSNFPIDDIRLPIGPVQSITSFLYDDATDVERAFAGYAIEHDRASASLSGAWPTGSNVRVRYVAGVGCPADLALAIRLLAAHWFAHREAATTDAPAEVPLGVSTLLLPYVRFMA